MVFHRDVLMLTGYATERWCLQYKTSKHCTNPCHDDGKQQKYGVHVIKLSTRNVGLYECN